MSATSDKFDTRVVDHLLRRGSLSNEDYETFLDALPDDAEHADATKTQFTATFASREANAEQSSQE